MGLALKATSLRTAFFKNATVNVARLAAGSVVALLLTPLLVRHLSKETYAAWVLIVQLSTYVMFLDFGIQNAVSHFVAYTEEKQDLNLRDGIVSSAVWSLAGLAAIGVLLIGGLAWQLPRLFDDLPESLQPVTRTSLLLVGISMAIGLPVSAMAAVFLGRQQNQVPVGIAIAGRLLSGALIAGAALVHRSLVWMAAAFAVANLVTHGLHWAAWHRWAADVHIARSLVSRDVMRRLRHYCWGITVWLLGGLLVSGLDTAIVGVVDFDSLGYFGVATMLTLFLIHFQGAVMNALLPAAAMLHARDDRQRLGELLVRSTRYGLVLLLLVGLPMIVAAEPLLELWVGAHYGPRTAPILQVLVAANIIRLVGLPYATLVVGTNQQHLVMRSPITEGVVNVLVSIWAGRAFGAIGVAIGTLVGAFFSIGFHLLYSMPRTVGIQADRHRLLREGILHPLLCGIPLLLLMIVLTAIPEPPGPLRLLLISGAAALTLVLLWNLGLADTERRRVLPWVLPWVQR
jgi:O-antigen/teichoic acid export membrane protein